MKIFNQNIKSEEGNVLFLILIAVALFAALSYAVTQSGGGGSQAGRETNLIRGSQVTQYPAQVKQGVTRMLVGSGVPGKDLAFNPPSEFGTGGSNKVDPANDREVSRAVFHPNGGGVSFQDRINLGGDTETNTWTFVANHAVKNIGTDNPEIIAIADGVPQGICNSINDRLNLPDVGDMGTDIIDMSNVSTTIGQSATGSANADQGDGKDSSGNFNNTVTATIGASEGNLSGQRFGCVDIAGGEDNAYYHVILER